MTRVEKMSVGDVADCVALVVDSPLMQQYGYGAVAAHRDLEAALRARNDELWVARDDERKVLGFAWIVPRGAFARSAYLRLILVDPAAARRGVGRALLAACEAGHVARAGLFLLCGATNERARAFYAQLGYVEVGQIPAYTGAGRDELIFYKPAGEPQGRG